MKFAIVAGLAIAIVNGSAAGVHAQVIDTLALREDLRALSHDTLLGRATGSAGERAAAAIIVSRLASIGLSPVGPDGFRVALPLSSVRLDDSSRIAVHNAADTAVFVPWRDFILLAAGRSALRAFDGPAIFIEDILRVRRQDVPTGSVVVTTGPVGEAGRHVMRAWSEAGISGVLLPVPGSSQYTGFHDRPRDLLVVDAAVDEPVWQPDLPVLVAGPALTRALFRDLAPAVGDSFPDLLRLGRSVDARLVFDRTPVQSANLAALLPGSDSVLRHEVVVLTAHYDHLGVGAPVNGDSIYNGFSDNAAGVAMLLAIAGALREEPPPRSVLFLFTSGEERGLLGASYWAAHPPLPLDRTAAVLNLDAGAPPAPPVRWRVAGDTLLGAVPIAARVVERKGWKADVTPANANSDHWPFMERGVPTVFLVPGREWEGLTDEQRDALHARWDRYHHPDDEYSPAFPLSGVERYAGLALEIVRALAGADAHELRR